MLNCFLRELGYVSIQEFERQVHVLILQCLLYLLIIILESPTKHFQAHLLGLLCESCAPIVPQQFQINANHMSVPHDILKCRSNRVRLP